MAMVGPQCRSAGRVREGAQRAWRAPAGVAGPRRGQDGGEHGDSCGSCVRIRVFAFLADHFFSARSSRALRDASQRAALHVMVEGRGHPAMGWLLKTNNKKP